MRAPLHPHARSDGFVLLHALWLLLAAAALVSGLLALTLRASTEHARSERQVKVTLAQESAIQQVIHDIISDGTGSRWLRAAVVTGNLDIEGQRVGIAVQNVDGLLDVGYGDRALLESLFRGVLGGDGSPLLERALARRDAAEGDRPPFSGYADLRAVLQASDEQFACLYSHITLFSRKPEPRSAAISSRLSKILGGSDNDGLPKSIMEDDLSSAGETFRVTATIDSGQERSQALVVEVSITGQSNPSHLIRDFRKTSTSGYSDCK